MNEFADPRRTIGNLVQLGTVESVDLASQTCRVRVGDNLTGDVPWFTPRAGDLFRIWAPPSVGEQVELRCPEGDMEGAIVGGSLFCDAFPPPSAEAAVVLAFKDGTEIMYDPQEHLLRISIGAGGSAELVAPGGLLIEADVEITGTLDASGTITSADDVVGGGKSLKNHRHTNVQAGAAVSGPPQ